jgi:hypothetical protein
MPNVGELIERRRREGHPCIRPGCTSVALVAFYVRDPIQLAGRVFVEGDFVDLCPDHDHELRDAALTLELQLGELPRFGVNPRQWVRLWEPCAFPDCTTPASIHYEVDGLTPLRIETRTFSPGATFGVCAGHHSEINPGARAHLRVLIIPTGLAEAIMFAHQNHQPTRRPLLPSPLRERPPSR